MAMNLASKYSSKAAERFTLKSVTDIGLCKDYDWSGVKTVTVYSVDTVAMADYTRSGSSRYGTITELGNTKQDLTLSKDRGFTFSIDKGNMTETVGVMEAGKALARQIDQVITPEIDIYRLSVWGGTTNTTGTAAAITSSNAYSKLLTAQEKLNDNKVPVQGRILYCTPAYYSAIKQDTSFVLASDIMAEKRVNGQVGEIDGVKVIMVPSSYMPTNCAFILIHPSCSCSPMKLEDYKTHDNPPGISGQLVEGRVIYDCFILDAKDKAICKHMTATA